MKAGVFLYFVFALNFFYACFPIEIKYQDSKEMVSPKIEKWFINRFNKKYIKTYDRIRAIFSSGQYGNIGQMMILSNKSAKYLVILIKPNKEIKDFKEFILEKDKIEKIKKKLEYIDKAVDDLSTVLGVTKVKLIHYEKNNRKFEIKNQASISKDESKFSQKLKDLINLISDIDKN